MNFLRKQGLITLLLLVALFLRLYHVSATMTFLEDEGRDLLVVHRMLDTGRPVLLGPQTSTGNMYLGPLYYYLITPFLFLSGMNPLGPVIFIGVTGVLTAWLLYYLGSQWFGRSVGILSALMYALLPLPVIFTRNSWNPNLAPLIALLMLSSLVNIVRNKVLVKKDFFFLGLLAGALVQMHYMALLFLVGVGVALSYYLRRTLPTLLRGSCIALIGFTLILSPFILFEIRNDYVNTHALTRFIAAKEEHNIRYSLPISLWSSKVESTSTRLFASLFGRDALTKDPYRVTIALLVTALLVLTLLATRQKRDSSSRIYRILFLTFIIPLAATGIYQENIHLHYLGFFFPLIYLLLARSRYAWLFFIASLCYASPQLLSYLRSDGTNQVIRAQEVVAYILHDSAGRPYNLVSSRSTPSTPYQYFSAISKHPATTAAVPDVYLICQGAPCSNEDVNTPFFFITGQAHPSIRAYLGHPLSNYFEGERTLLSNDHVSHGAWVAKINVKLEP